MSPPSAPLSSAAVEKDRDELLFLALPMGLYWTTEVGFALSTTERLFSADLLRV